MNPSNPAFVVVAIFIAVCTAYFLPKKFVPEMTTTRFNSIDGIRGYLAFLVFLHHSIIWYFYLHTGVWQVPPTRLFRHFGQASVALFFMITSFLFLTKLLNSKKSGINWNRVYISRVLRLTPLYILAIFVIFAFVALISGGSLTEPLPLIAKNAMKWITFTVLGDPDLNGVKSTNLIIAGVSWSLPYEWFFYFSLPVFAFLLRIKVELPYLLFSLLSLIGFYFWGPQWYHLMAFLGGILAAFIVRYEIFKRILQSSLGAFGFIACILGIFFAFSTTYTMIPLTLLFMAFCVVAADNSIFGVFTHIVSRTLGEMAYSIYLLHGIFLFTTFKFILGYSTVKELTVIEYWSVIFLIIPFLIGFCYLSFNYIEKKAMDKTNGITKFLEQIQSRETKS